MTPPAGDPRVFFAAERTLLAWVRTGLAFMGFGFVLARYRLFLPAPAGEGVASLALGVGLVGLGVFTILAPFVQFRRFLRTLPPADIPENYSMRPALVSAIGLAAFGVLLALYLIVARPERAAGGSDAPDVRLHDGRGEVIRATALPLASEASVGVRSVTRESPLGRRRAGGR